MSTPTPTKSTYSNYGLVRAAAKYNDPLGPLKSAGDETRTLLVSYGNKFPYSPPVTPFYQVSSYWEPMWRTSSIDANNAFNQWVRGMVCLSGPATTAMPGVSMPSFLSAVGYAEPYGAVGWNRTRPTKSVASLAQSVGEVLKDGLPRMPGSQLGGALRRLPVWASLSRAGIKLGSPSTARDVRRALGSEYLNWDFGWRPMISDAQALVSSAGAIRERLRRWKQAGNGGTIRRRTTIKDEPTISSTRTQTSSIGSVHGLLSGGNWTGYKLDESFKHDKVWYAAGYRLNIPDAGSLMSDPMTVASLVGALPTPELAWELTPWSWLADWFTNVGDVMANLSDPLRHYYAAAYACVMFRREQYSAIGYTFSLTSPVGPGQYVRSCNPTTHSVAGRKRGVCQLRFPASPFGFGFTWDTLSSSQLATAAALGISRA